MSTWDKDKHREYMQGWRKRNKHKLRGYGRKFKLKKIYGITESRYQEMLLEQGLGCKVCAVPFDLLGKGRKRFPHIDHDHSSGAARALLCQRCNILVGFVESEFHEQAVQYVNLFKAVK